MEEYKNLFTSPIGVPMHCQIKHSIDLILGAPFPNEPIYRCLLLENEEIKCQIQELLQRGHIRPISSPYGSLIMLVKNKDGAWRLCIDYRSLNKIIVKIGTQSPKLKTSSTNSREPSSLEKLIWNRATTKSQSNKPMSGRLPSSLKRFFSNGWSCLLAWLMLQ